MIFGSTGGDSSGRSIITDDWVTFEGWIWTGWATIEVIICVARTGFKLSQVTIARSARMWKNGPGIRVTLYQRGKQILSLGDKNYQQATFTVPRQLCPSRPGYTAQSRREKSCIMCYYNIFDSPTNGESRSGLKARDQRERPPFSLETGQVASPVLLCNATATGLSRRRR